MSRGILQASVENRGLVLDPRTKLLLTFTMAIFVLGNMGGEALEFLHPILCVAPGILLITSKQGRKAIVYFVAYLSSYGLYEVFGPRTSGLLHYLLLANCGILARFMPSIAMAAYLVSTTTVSEFTAAMLRMKLSEKIIIPLSVMFRFFPTVIDEAASISAAMRMRDIRLGGKNAGKMLEYRLVPLMTCCVKIGEELSAAALTRGLGGEVRRTNICKIGFRFADWAVTVLCAVPYMVSVLAVFDFWR